MTNKSNYEVSVKEPFYHDKTVFNIYEIETHTYHEYILLHLQFENDIDEEIKYDTPLVTTKSTNINDELMFEIYFDKGRLHFYSTCIIDLFNELN